MVPAAIYQPLFYFLFYFFNLWFAILLCNRILYGCWMQVLLLFHRQTRKCIWCYIECHYGIVTYVHLIIATNVIHQICMTSGYTQWTHSSVLTCPSTSEFILDSQSKHRGKLHCSSFLTGWTDKAHPMLQHPLCWVLRGRTTAVEFLFFVSRLFSRRISACGIAISVSLGMHSESMARLNCSGRVFVREKECLWGSSGTGSTLSFVFLLRPLGTHRRASLISSSLSLSSILALYHGWISINLIKAMHTQ